MVRLVFDDGSRREIKFDPKTVARLIHASTNSGVRYQVDAVPALTKKQNKQVQKEMERIWLSERSRGWTVS